MAGTGELVFVYGTLRSGGSNAFRMASGKKLADATVRGRLYHIDWYPGLVLDPAAGPVAGELHEMPAPAMAELDAFEGTEYRRVTAAVNLADGGAATAWIWEWSQPVDESRRISHGDWLKLEHPEP